MENRKAGEFFITSISLTNQHKESVEISKLITGFRMYESIFKKYCTAELHFIDGLNLIKNFRFTGQEYVRIAVKMKVGIGEKADNLDSVDKVFRVYKAGSVKRLNDTTQAYVLNLCDPHMFSCERKRVSKVLRGSYDKMLQNILVEDAKIPPSEFDQWESTVPENHQMIVPNWKISKFIDFVVNNANIGTKAAYKNGMFFYQTLNGKYKFKSIDTMMQQEFPVAFSFRPRGENLDTAEADINSPEGLNSQILSYIKPQVFDTLRGTAAGAYSGSMKVYDPIRKIEEDIVYDIEETFKRGQHVSGNWPMILTDGAKDYQERFLTTEDLVEKTISPQVTEIGVDLAPNKEFNSIVLYDYTTTHVFDNASDHTAAEAFVGMSNKDNAKLERNALLEILQQHKIVVTIPFRTDISVGTIIILKLPEPQVAGSAGLEDVVNDNRYLITDLCMDGDATQSAGVLNIECVKESFAVDISSANPQAGMEAPEEY